jgi:superfamily II DNA/RNA helicase
MAGGKTFSELGVSAPLLRALEKQHIAVPTAIQELAMPVVAEGRQVYLHSETGSGKTLAYLLPLFEKLDLKREATQVVVLAPTHELAIQIQRQACDLAQHSGMAVKTLLLIGGTSMDRQLEKLKKKPHLVVGSPGRVRDLMTLGKVKANTVRTLVLDEADTLLGGEGAEMVRRIVSLLPAQRQVVMVSATRGEGVLEVAGELAPGHALIETGPEPVNERIEHVYLVCEQRDKPDVLRKAIHAFDAQRALVFVHKNARAEVVSAKLAHHKIEATDLHGAFDKESRKRAMEDFRSGRARVMIASDVASRGLDIPGVTHVFNLDAPSQSKVYTHRVGRTGRAGASGVAVSVLTELESRLVRRWEAELGIRLQEVRLREGRVVPVGGPGRRG